MGIGYKIVKGTGIKFLITQEISELIRIVRYFVNTDEEKADYNQYYSGNENMLILEMLEVFLPESIEIKFFGNSVCETNSNPQGVMLVGNVDEIANIIRDLKLNKHIQNLEEIYIG